MRKLCRRGLAVEGRAVGSPRLRAPLACDGSARGEAGAGGPPLRLLLALALGAIALGPISVAAQERDALEIAREHLELRAAELGLSEDDIREWRVTDRYQTRHNGVTHLYLCQQHRGIDVFNAFANLSIDPEGRVIGLGNGFQRRLRRATRAEVPRVSARRAVRRAVAGLGRPVPRRLSVLERRGGAAREIVFAPGGVSLDPIPVRLEYLPVSEGDVRLSWRVLLRERTHWWDVHVDALTGAVLRVADRVKTDSYRVFALPLESPDAGGRTLELDPADPVASPFGWHDSDGAPGPEFTNTNGNNCAAHEDVDGDNSFGFSPSGGPGLVFDFPLNLAQQPISYQAAAITNAFYWTNVLHDLYHRYGFDEPAGNFQSDNYGNGGFGNDPVIVDAQDGARGNNASFGTSPDGSPARMTVHLWRQSAELEVNAPPAIATTYPAGYAVFGPDLSVASLTGNVVAAVDDTEPDVNDACEPITNGPALAGNIALIDRGNCNFDNKVERAQTAGAIGVIMVNNAGNIIVNMGGGDDVDVTIPSLFIGQGDGDLIKSQLLFGLNATLRGESRDADLDNGILIHEYGHGVSLRLTGGPSTVSCLDPTQSAGLGEGWSDFWAIALTAQSGDARADSRAIAAYARNFSGGIRRFPYSVDLGVNALTYADIALDTEEHAVGEVWAATLWEMFWNLVDVRGFDPDLYTGSGGNNTALQLVMDGLKLQPCDPTFLEARDAILQADVTNDAGANKCRLWLGFAKRGLGTGALDGGGADSVAVTESFAPAPECSICGDVNDDEEFSLLDVVLTSRAQAGFGPGLIGAEKCNTAGSADLADLDANGLPDDCLPDDLSAMREELAGLSPGIAAVCGPAVGVFP